MVVFGQGGRAESIIFMYAYVLVSGWAEPRAVLNHNYNNLNFFDMLSNICVY